MSLFSRKISIRICTQKWKSKCVVGQCYYIVLPVNIYVSKDNTRLNFFASIQFRIKGIENKNMVAEKNRRLKFYAKKFPYDEIFYMAKLPYGETRVRLNILRRNSPTVKFPYAEIFLRQNLLNTKFPIARFSITYLSCLMKIQSYLVISSNSVEIGVTFFNLIWPVSAHYSSTE